MKISYIVHKLRESGADAKANRIVKALINLPFSWLIRSSQMSEEIEAVQLRKKLSHLGTNYQQSKDKMYGNYLISLLQGNL